VQRVVIGSAEPLCTAPPSYGLSFSELRAFGHWIYGPGLPPLRAPISHGARYSVYLSLFSSHALSCAQHPLPQSWSLPFLPGAFQAPYSCNLQRWVSRPPAPQRRLTISLLWTIWMGLGALSAPRAGDSSSPIPWGAQSSLSAALFSPPQFSPPFLRWPTMRHLQTACSQLQLLHPCSQRVAWGHAASYRHGPGCSNCRLRLRLCHNPPSFSTPCSSCSLEHARVWRVAGGHATLYRCLLSRSVASHFHPDPLPRLTPGGRRCLALWSALAADPALAFLFSPPASAVAL
jgi:hypothetical protein